MVWGCEPPIQPASTAYTITTWKCVLIFLLPLLLVLLPLLQLLKNYHFLSISFYSVSLVFNTFRGSSSSSSIRFIPHQQIKCNAIMVHNKRTEHTAFSQIADSKAYKSTDWQRREKESAEESMCACWCILNVLKMNRTSVEKDKNFNFLDARTQGNFANLLLCVWCVCECKWFTNCVGIDGDLLSTIWLLALYFIFLLLRFFLHFAHSHTHVIAWIRSTNHNLIYISNLIFQYAVAKDTCIHKYSVPETSIAFPNDAAKLFGKQFSNENSI